MICFIEQIADACTYEVVERLSTSVAIKWIQNLDYYKLPITSIIVIIQEIGPQYLYENDPYMAPIGDKIELIYYTNYITLNDLKGYTAYSICFYPLPMQSTYYDVEFDCVRKEDFQTAEGGQLLYDFKKM